MRWATTAALILALFGAAPAPTGAQQAKPAPKRAKPGQRVNVQLTAYCLRGRTRMGHRVRPGIVAADPRVFPLGSHVDVWVGGKRRGRYLVSDTGRLIRGARLDLWMESCPAAIRFGRRQGAAVLVAAGGA